MSRMEVEEMVIQQIRDRRDVGRSKYGTTMQRTDLSIMDWLQHAQEEALDLAVYLERIKQDVEVLARAIYDAEDIQEILLSISDIVPEGCRSAVAAARPQDRANEHVRSNAPHEARRDSGVALDGVVGNDGGNA